MDVNANLLLPCHLSILFGNWIESYMMFVRWFVAKIHKKMFKHAENGFNPHNLGVWDWITTKRNLLTVQLQKAQSCARARPTSNQALKSVELFGLWIILWRQWSLKKWQLKGCCFTVWRRRSPRRADCHEFCRIARSHERYQLCQTGFWSVEGVFGGRIRKKRHISFKPSTSHTKFQSDNALQYDVMSLQRACYVLCSYCRTTHTILYRGLKSAVLNYRSYRFKLFNGPRFFQLSFRV